MKKIEELKAKEREYKTGEEHWQKEIAKTKEKLETITGYEKEFTKDLAAVRAEIAALEAKFKKGTRVRVTGTAATIASGVGSHRFGIGAVGTIDDLEPYPNGNLRVVCKNVAWAVHPDDLEVIPEAEKKKHPFCRQGCVYWRNAPPFCVGSCDRENGKECETCWGDMCSVYGTCKFTGFRLRKPAFSPPRRITHSYQLRVGMKIRNHWGDGTHHDATVTKIEISAPEDCRVEYRSCVYGVVGSRRFVDANIALPGQPIIPITEKDNWVERVEESRPCSVLCEIPPKPCCYPVGTECWFRCPARCPHA